MEKERKKTERGFEYGKYGRDVGWVGSWVGEREKNGFKMCKSCVKKEDKKMRENGTMNISLNLSLI